MTTAVADESVLDSRTGWVIVGLGLGLLILIWGTVFTFTVYEGELAAAFGLSSLRASSIFSVTLGAFFLAGGTISIVIARLPLRPVVAALGVTFAVVVGALQVVTTYAGVAVAFGVFGAASGTAFIVIISLVPQWFDVYEGRAMGVTLSGSGIAIFVLPFVWLWLFERTDIRGAFAVVCGATALLLLVASVVYRRPPGVGRTGTTSVDVAWLRSLLTDRRFQAAAPGFALLWTWYFVLSADIVDMLTTIGVTRGVATAAFGTIGGVSVVTRVASGVVADRVGLRVTLTGGVVLASVGLVLLPGAGARPLLYASLLAFGVGLGAVAALFSPVIIRGFGPENATAVVGLFTLSEATTAFLAPIGMSALVDATGGYTVPLATLVAMTLVGAGLFYWGTTPTAGTPTGR